MLLAGRVVAILLNLAVQVLTIRYLSKNDYGAFAYALGVIGAVSGLLQLGLDKALQRLIPIYLERRDFGRVGGGILLASGTICGFGAACVLLLHAYQGAIAQHGVRDPLSLSLLLVIALMAPIDAFDGLLQRLTAIFVGARAIFFRRHIAGPALRLGTVVVLMLAQGTVFLLAYGYVIGALIGVGLNVAILLREWRKKGLLRHMHPRLLHWPIRELFGFGLPLSSTQLSLLMQGGLATVLLGYYHSPAQVAEYRAVLPFAHLNTVAYEAFGFLFVPLASRMFARGDRHAISEAYWETALWITVLTFPVVAVTCSLAEPVTVFFFGERYAAAGTILSIMAMGRYLDAALGFNEATLRVHGKVRFIATSDVLGGLAACALHLLLIPPYGALGAAIGSTGGLVVRNASNQVGLVLCDTGVRFVQWHFVRVHAVTTLAMLALLGVQWALNPPLYVGLGLTGLVTLVVIRLTRRAIRPETHFPELMRFPLVRQLLR